MEDLIEGFYRFKENKDNYGPDGLMRHLVSKGQKPDYFIVSCIDSRSNPGVIFDGKSGSFLAHKAMGAIVRPYKKGTALAAGLQFAIEHIKISKIIVLGHTNCGAIKALVDKIPDEDIASFVEVAQGSLAKAREKTGEKTDAELLLRETEKQTVLMSAQNLKTYPPVARAVEENRVQIRSWIFDMTGGNLLEFDSEKEDFIAVKRGKTEKKQSCSC